MCHSYNQFGPLWHTTMIRNNLIFLDGHFDRRLRLEFNGSKITSDAANSRFQENIPLVILSFGAPKLIPAENSL